MRAEPSWPAEVIRHIPGAGLSTTVVQIVRPFDKETGKYVGGLEPDSNLCVSIDVFARCKKISELISYQKKMDRVPVTF